MTSLEAKVKSLTASSRQVLSDCSLPNGAIVAANTDTPYYPREAANYRFVWPRDASFVTVAAPLVGLSLGRPFFDWLYKYPEDFKKEGLLYANYATNGRLGSFGTMFAPDQMGTVLWALDEYLKRSPNDATHFKPLAERLADGLSRIWRGRYFLPNTVDVWEDGFRKTSSKVENNFTYSLAACAAGLELAGSRYQNRRWKKVAGEMKKEIDEAWSEALGAFARNHGRLTDKNIDASLLGLAWPFEILDYDDPRLIKTVAKIEAKLVEHGGVHRFQYDYFDSEGTAWEGGGAWPILNFWLAIYWAKRGDRARGLAYFRWVLERVDQYIPEQLFNDFRVGIYPLAWSHALFLLAAQVLNLLPHAKT